MAGGGKVRSYDPAQPWVPGMRKFRPEATEAALLGARMGLTLGSCAKLAGVTYQTLRTWLDEGLADDAPPDKREFAIEFECNRANVELDCWRALDDLLDDEDLDGRLRLRAIELKMRALGMLRDRGSSDSADEEVAPATPVGGLTADAVVAMSPDQIAGLVAGLEQRVEARLEVDVIDAEEV